MCSQGKTEKSQILGEKFKYSIKGELKMSGDLRHINNVRNSNAYVEKNNVKAEKKENEPPLVHESCNCSGFSMAALGGALLLFAGILLYAIVI